MSAAVPLSKYGPIVEITFGVCTDKESRLLARGEKVPGRARIPALIDTGSTGTCMAESYLTALGITPVSPVNHIAMHRSRLAWQYWGTLAAVLGQDVLNHCLFTYNGKERSFTLDAAE